MFLLRRILIMVATLLAIPFLVVWAAVLLSVNLLYRCTRFLGRSGPGSPDPVSGKASIIVLNWNGKDLLAEGIPTILDAVHADGRAHEIIVVDNGSSDGSVEYVERSFPDVRVVRLSENLGFGAGNNAGVRTAQNDIVVLLNNDMLVDRGFLRPLLEGFLPDTFGVSSQIFHQDPAARREETGKTSACFRRGMIDYEHRPVDSGVLPRPYYPVFWAGGGSSAYHREQFLALGGFQETFSPAYVEDTDISYRAWKAGWQVRFAPGSIVHHKHRASSGRRFTAARLERLVQRNQLLFLWKNIDSWPLLLSHCMLLPWNWYRLARDHGAGIWLGFLRAAGRFPAAQLSRFTGRLPQVRSDEEVLEIFAAPGRHLASRRPPSQPATGGCRSSVLWVTAYLPHLGRHAGAGRMFHLIKRTARKYRVTLLAFIESDEEREFVPELESFCEKVVVLPRKPPPRWQPFAYEPFEEFRTPAMERALQDCLEQQDFDLIQLEYSQMACYGDKRLRVPTVLTKHEVDFAACLRRAHTETQPARKLRWFYNYLQVLDREIALLRRVDAAVCMTDEDAVELKKFCAGVPIHVINTGVDLDYFRPAEKPARDPTLVFVGAFRHEPNVDAMVYFCNQILPLIQAEQPKTKLLIVGSSPPPVIAGLASLPGVEVTGFVPDIRPFMAAAAVYVVPLRLGVGIRGKILEAWAMGMAVVATPVACAGLRYKDGETLLVAEQPDRFVAQVLSLLRNPSERLRLGREGRRMAEEFYSWDAAARQLDALYQAQIGSPVRAQHAGKRPAEQGCVRP